MHAMAGIVRQYAMHPVLWDGSLSCFQDDIGQRFSVVAPFQARHSTSSTWLRRWRAARRLSQTRTCLGPARWRARADARATRPIRCACERRRYAILGGDVHYEEEVW